MATVIIPGVGKVDNVTGKVISVNTVNPKLPVQKPKPKVTPTPNVVTPIKTIPGVGQVGGNGQIAVQAPNTSIPVPKPQPVVKQQTNTTGNNNTVSIAGPPKASGTYANNAYGYIDKVYDAKAQNTYNSYKNAYNNTMTTINRAAAEINPAYQAEKQKATSQSELQKLNFAQYLQSRGVGSGGQMQAELSRQSALGNTLGTLQTNKLKALETVQNQRTDAATQFNQKWADYLGTSGLSKMDAIQNQKKADAKAAADAAKAAANAAKAAKSSSTSGSNTKTKTKVVKPQDVEKEIMAQFKMDVTYAEDDKFKTTPLKGVVAEKDKPYVWKYIINSNMTPDQTWNMMNKYGLGPINKSTGTPLGPNNLRLFIANIAATGDKRLLATYLNKLGIKEKMPNGKTIPIEQQVKNILSNKDRYGNKYPAKE